MYETYNTSDTFHVYHRRHVRGMTQSRVRYYISDAYHSNAHTHTYPHKHLQT